MKIQHTLDIAAPPTRVWDVTIDVEALPEHTPTMTDVTVLDGSPLGIGSTVRIKQPAQRAKIWTITELAPDERFSWVTTSRGLTMTARHDLAAAASNTVTFDNGAIGRLNAWFFDHFDRYINVISRRHKHDAFADIGAGTVLEIGAGVGANFDYVSDATRLIALEPNEAMHPRLIERANARGIDVRIVGASAERIPAPDDSIDTVLCSLVLCTVTDPAAALSEIVRVLRPGGTFRFVEHVAAHPISPRRWIQTALRRPWSWLFEGCQLCRHTGSVIETSGLTDADIRTGRLRCSAFVPVNRVIYGRATKPVTDRPINQGSIPPASVADPCRR